MLTHAVQRLKDALHIRAIGGQLRRDFQRHPQRLPAGPATLSQILSGNDVDVAHDYLTGDG